MRGYYLEQNYCTFGEVEVVRSKVDPKYDLAYVHVNGITGYSENMGLYDKNLKTPIRYKIALLSQIVFISEIGTKSVQTKLF